MSVVAPRRSDAVYLAGFALGSALATLEIASGLGHLAYGELAGATYGAALISFVSSRLVGIAVRPWLLLLGSAPALALGLILFLMIPYPLHLIPAFLLVIGGCMAIDDRNHGVA